MTNLPEPAEAQALADALRDMMTADRPDQGVLRRAANALQALADAACVVTFAHDTDGGPDPLRGHILSSFEGGEGGDDAAIARCQ